MLWSGGLPEAVFIIAMEGQKGKGGFALFQPE